VCQTQRLPGKGYAMAIRTGKKDEVLENRMLYAGAAGASGSRNWEDEQCAVPGGSGIKGSK